MVETPGPSMKPSEEASDPGSPAPPPRRRWLAGVSIRTRRYLFARTRRGATSVAKDIIKGFAIAVLMVAATWVLYQLGLVAQGAP
ncbi:MAG: hypothetical protein QOJ81_246 [Chloroflexota bacterium]|nr:hypothetical protein [Chloroflexota bacterium]